MRKLTDLEPRLAALSARDLAVKPGSSSWMPQNGLTCVSLDPARWSQRNRQATYWRMVEILNRARTLH
jgi:hypothetical protein